MTEPKTAWNNKPLVYFFVATDMKASLFDRIQWYFEDIPAARSVCWTLRRQMYGLTNNHVGRPALWDALVTEAVK